VLDLPILFSPKSGRCVETHQHSTHNQRRILALASIIPYNLRKRCVEWVRISIFKKTGPASAGTEKACQGDWQAFATSKAACLGALRPWLSRCVKKLCYAPSLSTSSYAGKSLGNARPQSMSVPQTRA